MTTWDRITEIQKGRRRSMGSRRHKARTYRSRRERNEAFVRDGLARVPRQTFMREQYRRWGSR